MINIKIKHTERDCLIEVHGHACFISIVGAMVFRPSENDISFNPKFFRDSDAYSKLIKEQVKKGYWAKGTTIERNMIHEAEHVLEFVLLNMNVICKNSLQKEIA